QTGFYIERELSGGTFAQIATVTSGTTYTDTTLSEATSYVYRVRAYGSTGDSSYSLTKSVSTPVNAPTNLTATTVSTTEIDLAWADNSSQESFYSLQRSTDGGNTWSTTIQLPANTTSYQDTGLTEGTTYTYQVQALKTGKNSAFTSSQSATTLPAAPSDVVATVNSDTQVTVTWTNNSVGATGATIQREVGGVWSLAGTVGAGIATFTDTGLTELTTYSYRVEATGSSGASAWANGASSVTTLPAAPSGLTVSAPESDQVTLMWTDNSAGATAYQVQRNDNVGSGWVTIATTDSSATTYTDVTVSEATDYSYRVRTVSNALNSAYSNTASITTVPLDPDTLAATTISTSEIDLTWNDNSAGATHYLVERSDDGGNTFNQIATLNGTANSYNDTGLTEGFSYQYQVRAQDDGGYSGYTDSVEATTLPAAATGLTATPTAGQIALNWTDVSNGEISYTVQRDNSGTWTTLSDLPANATSFTDTGATGGLDSGTTYQYRIFCTNPDGGNSAYTTMSATAT
ncbi:MAG TPA: fibronectin type III domain-containing protein, partial [Tepidisphaeraceae bacterium]|nr:fibronectin type III domain-containing protein [Tepidisphaeraceae bacterium]